VDNPTNKGIVATKVLWFIFRHKTKVLWFIFRHKPKVLCIVHMHGFHSNFVVELFHLSHSLISVARTLSLQPCKSKHPWSPVAFAISATSIAFGQGTLNT
jgi:hypothetical protein